MIQLRYYRSMSIAEIAKVVGSQLLLSKLPCSIASLACGMYAPQNAGELKLESPEIDEFEQLVFDWEDGQLDDVGINRLRQLLPGSISGNAMSKGRSSLPLCRWTGMRGSRRAVMKT